MKKKNLRKIKTFLGLLGISINTVALSTPPLSYYENATLSVNYKGNIGEFSQLLADKLGVGYYSFQAHPSTKINLEKMPKASLNQLFSHINQQIKGQRIRFDILNDNVVLTLVGENTQPLEKPQFISDISYQEETPPAFSTIDFQKNEKTDEPSAKNTLTPLNKQNAPLEETTPPPKLQNSQ
ncbi:hypothetical protein [Avibacterium sp. 21-599]|uniref:hypothetical protein n=1 Tax=Avibacterium sp. 21-599 TaxID=2911528 RepID=UPI002246C775|nr:hypothetical protein [Avibacterium sp. 21-599]MCW9718210.1 hypothetical protein [Avibacterium sp. 21-599]